MKGATFPRKRRGASRVMPGPDPDHPARDPAGPSASRRYVPVPGVRDPRGAGPSHAPLGRGWPDHAIKPGAPLPPPSPGRARGGLPDHARAGWHRPGPPPRRPAPPGSTASGAGPRRPGGALRAEHAAQGLQLTAKTTCPLWLGERLDLVWAIDVLHPLATGERNRSAPEAAGIPPPSRRIASVISSLLAAESNGYASSSY